MAAPSIPGVTFAGPLTAPVAAPTFTPTKPAGAFSYQYAYTWSADGGDQCNGDPWLGDSPSATGNPEGTSLETKFSPAGTITQNIAIQPIGQGPIITVAVPPAAMGYSDVITLYRTEAGGSTFYYLDSQSVTPGSVATVNFGSDGTTDAQLLSTGFTPTQRLTNPDSSAYSITADSRCTTYCAVRTSDFLILETSDAAIVATGQACSGNPGSGLYRLTPGKKYDTIYVDSDGNTEDVKIPNPFADTAFLGDEI